MAQKPKEGNSVSSTTADQQNESITNGECSICMEKLSFVSTKPCPPFPPKPIEFPLIIDTHKIVLLHCNHSFHYTCIQQWFARSKNCPLCRRQSYQPMSLPSRVMDDWGSPTPPRVITGEQAVLQHLLNKAARRDENIFWFNIYGDILPNILTRN